MELSVLINAFKQQKQFEQKVLSFLGQGAYSIEGVEKAIVDGFTSDHLIFGCLNTVTKKEWEYAHVEIASNGEFKISSDMPHTGIKDVYATNVDGVMKAICSILNKLISE